MDETNDWVVVRRTNGAYRLVRAVVLPVGGHGSVLVPRLPESESADVERVANAPSWRGLKRSARFSSGMACIRCEGTRRTGPLPVALLSKGGQAFVATLNPSTGGAWEFAIRPHRGGTVPANAGSGSFATAESAFDAVAEFAALHGFDFDPRPSPILEGGD